MKQTIERLRQSIEDAKRRAQEITNGEYAEYFEDTDWAKELYLPPSVTWAKAKELNEFEGILWGKAEEKGLSAEFILREFELGE